METDKDHDMEADSCGQADQVGSDEEDSCEEIVMETLEEVELGAGRVNVAVSHESLAAHLRPLERTKTAVRAQAQGDCGSPTRKGDKTPNDLKNKLVLKPIIAKAPRPTAKTNSTQ